MSATSQGGRVTLSRPWAVASIQDGWEPRSDRAGSHAAALDSSSLVALFTGDSAWLAAPERTTAVRGNGSGDWITTDITPNTGQYFEADGKCTSKVPPFFFSFEISLTAAIRPSDVQPSQALGVILAFVQL